MAESADSPQDKSLPALSDTLYICWIALRGDSHTTHTIILTYKLYATSLLQKVKSGKGRPRLAYANV